MSTGSGSAGHPGRSEPIVHVRGDSDSQMDDLFRVLEDPNKGIQKPFSKRKLPPSFFKPPEPRPGNHSREGSKDGTFPAPPVLTVAHQRSQSSPAQLPHSLSVPPPITPQHMKQASLGDYTEDSLTPLPPGWEMAKTADGQRYYLNHLDQTTSWVDPRKSLSTTALNHMHVGHPGQSPPPHAPLSPPQSLSPGSLSPSVSLQNLPPLPPGWEQATTPAGEVYFINHNGRTTSWFDPRLPKQMQKAGMKKEELLRQHLLLAQQSGTPSPPAHSPSPQPAPPATSTSPPLRLPPAVSLASSADPASIHLKMQMLEQENEMLRKRQQEMLRQMTNLSVQKNQLGGEDIMLISGSTAMTSQTMSPSIGVQSGEMTTMTSSGLDPFLSQDPITTTSESHARQNSADSGLGGMGTNYSLPRTPEDLLGNVDEMDTQETGQKLQQTDFNLNDLTSSSMEVGNIGENSNDGTAMDSDDLVPSIDSVDLFNGVDVQKMESLLTWL